MKKKVIKKKVEQGKKIFYFVLRIILSVFIGFLPSFVFIALFIQYGSPFVNYINFLFDFNSSALAWASAVVVGFFVYFIIWVIKTRKNFKKMLKKRIFLITALICLFVALFLIITQLYLYLNFISGNDVLIKLSADKDNLFFEGGVDEEVNFKTSVIMNPFCSAQCEYELFDISNNKLIEKGKFDIFSIFSKSKAYTFDKDALKLGQVLEQFEVTCKSKKTILCYTKEKESKRSVLITLNYDLNEEEKQLKDNSKEQLMDLGDEILSIEEIINISETNINSIDNLFSEDFSSQLYYLSRSFVDSNKSFIELKELWKTQDFVLLADKINNSKEEIKNNYADAEQLTSDIELNISLYNNLVNTLKSSRELLSEISQTEITASLCSELDSLVGEFNQSIDNFKDEKELAVKKNIVDNIFFKTDALYEEIQSIGSSEIISSCSLSQDISEESLEKINLISFNKSEIVFLLEEPDSLCCYFGDCDRCCNDDCSDEDYPIIFLHGHSINKALPVDYSFDSFSDIKSELAKEGYVDAGTMIISSSDEEKGLLGKVHAPMMVTASYFFDAYREENEVKIVASNVDSIDTYAIRLRDIVDLIKYRTNKNKVILVAQSGGGLVARRYIQIFGGEDVDKMILITVPNHGVGEKTEGYCVLFGPEAACKDMYEDSIFINKLNSGETDKVEAYNIIGIGCDMDDETGDGIIKNSSQYLDYATNYYVKGSCNELAFEFFHEYIVYPSQYPETYALVKEILEK